MVTVEIQLLIERVAVLDDEKAFEKIFHLYYKKLKRFANAIVKDIQLSEEIVCDVFIKIWNNRSRLTEVKNLNSYLYIVTKNTAIKSMTKPGNRELLNLEGLQIEPVVLSRNPEEILLNNELIETYEAAINKLPSKCQTIYRMAKQHGLRYTEIAEILNISIKTVDAQLAIAVKRVAQAIRLFYQLN